MNFILYDGTDIVTYLLYANEALRNGHLKAGDIVKIERPSACPKSKYFKGQSTVKKGFCLRSIIPTTIEVLEDVDDNLFATFMLQLENILPQFDRVFDNKKQASDFYETWKNDPKRSDICVIGLYIFIYFHKLYDSHFSFFNKFS